MPFGGALTGGIGAAISGLAGLFGGGNQQKTKTSGTITNSGTGTATGSSTLTSGNTANVTHQLSPFQQQLANLFTRGASDLYNSATDMSGYRSAGLQQINQGSDLANQVIKNTLASRGLSFSPAAANADIMNQQSRIAQGNQFLEQVPLLQRQLQQQALGQVVGAFSALPTDVSTTSTGTQSGTSSMDTTQNNTQTQQGTNLISGNPLGGLFSGIGTGLFGPNGSGGSNLSDILSVLFGSRNNGFNLDHQVATGGGNG